MKKKYALLILIAIISVSVVQEYARADVTFQPNMALNLTHTDNLFLTADNQVPEYITEVIPGFRYDVNSPLLVGKIDYNVQVNLYNEYNKYNEAFQNLNSHMTINAVDQNVFVDLLGNISQVDLESTGLLSPNDNISVTKNRSNLYVYGISPRLEFNNKYLGNILISKSAYAVDYSANTKYNSKVDISYISLDKNNTDTLFQWKLDALSNKVEYLTGEKVTLDDYKVQFTQEVSQKTSLVYTYGYERNVIMSGNVVNSENMGAYWNVGFNWENTKNKYFILEYGYRNDGALYGAKLGSKGSRVEIELGYDQHYTNSALQTIGYVKDYKDSVYIRPLYDNNLSNGFYLQNTGKFALKYKYSKSTLALGVDNIEKKYPQVGTRDNILSISTDYSLKISALSELSVDYVVNKLEYTEAIGSDELVTTGMQFKRLIGSKSSATLRLSHNESNTISNTFNYTSNIASIAFLWNYN